MFNTLFIPYLAVTILVLETVVLFGYLVRRNPDLAYSVLFNGLSGLCLMGAVLTALLTRNLIVIAVWLTGSFAAHLMDLVPRLRSSEHQKPRTFK